MIPNTSLPKTPAVAVYKALITQSSTTDPTAIVLQNTTGLTWVWTREGTGEYKLTPSTPTDITKTLITMPNNGNASNKLSASPFTNDEITLDWAVIETKNVSDTMIDGALYFNAITIEIYK